MRTALDPKRSFASKAAASTGQVVVVEFWPWRPPREPLRLRSRRGHAAGIARLASATDEQEEGLVRSRSRERRWLGPRLAPSLGHLHAGAQHLGDAADHSSDAA